MAALILPDTGRGTMRGMVEGALHRRCAQPRFPSTARRAVPLPARGEE